jgi:hypothetical protein
MADVQLHVPHLARHMFMDRDWIWYCGPTLQGAQNLETRGKLKGFGFRFSPGGHLMPDGQTKGHWGHCCEKPMGPRRRRRPTETEEQPVAAGPDWSELGL